MSTQHERWHFPLGFVEADLDANQPLARRAKFSIPSFAGLVGEIERRERSISSAALRAGCAEHKFNSK